MDISIHIANDNTGEEAVPVFGSPERIDAVMPDSAPLGRVWLTVTYRGQRSVPYRLKVVESGFGVFTRNGQGWGPGLIRGAGQPGEGAIIEGTGLGGAVPTQIAVYVGGRTAQVLGARRGSQKSGHDEIRFQIPPAAPLGCFVPVQVTTRAAAGGEIASNTVTMAIARPGQPCPRTGNWMESAATSGGKRAAIVLLRSNIQVAFASGKFRTFVTDEVSAFFRERRRASGPVSPAQLLPPPGTCITYAQTMRLRPILAAAGTGGRAFGGRALDAGPLLTLRSAAGERTIGKDPRDGQSYHAHLGGETLGGKEAARPLFLNRGEYEIAGSACAGPMRTKSMLSIAHVASRCAGAEPRRTIEWLSWR